MNDIECNRATDFLPKVIAQKVQSIARENGVETFELLLDRFIDPYRNQTYLLPRNTRAWFYTGEPVGFSTIMEISLLSQM